LRTGFSILDRFFLGMVLVDNAGTILASRPLLTVGYGRPIGKFTFKRDITLPSHAVAMAFSFRGRAREGGNGKFGRNSDGIEWYFQKTPY